MSTSLWPAGVSFNNGVLHISGISAHTLAKDFATPAFFIDEDDFRARAMGWNKALNQSFGGNAGNVYYAAKAFISVEVARWIADCGIGIDVCTGGELAVALAGGIDPQKIEVHGNNKSVSEIERAVAAGVGTIVMDSLFEIERVAAAARKLGKTQRVLLRLTPGIEAHTHESIATAHEDVKFGFSIASGAAWNAILEVRKYPELELRGFHSHIGSQILNMDSFEIAADRLIGLLAKFRDEFSAQLPELDLGGGYGIAYLPGDVELEASEVLPALYSQVKNACESAKLDIPKVSIEPGRAIVGPTMFTLYEVGTVKDVTLESGKIRHYISVDGGMSDNIRPSLYGAKYTTSLANRSSSAPLVDSRLVGKHCETGDIVIRDIELPSDIAPGDLLAVPATGAYGRSMASNYNHIPRPPVIAVKDGKARVILRRETEADLLNLDI
ncbi:MAG: diaminopimelate decarboxylase [Candidatus Planktophila sp.]|jgi:diaminopimelate decarboxylase|nr:diaminopimelate decarboxylase [Candidatus Planktophila sp.]